MAEYGSKFFNVRDVDRCGLFGEMSYMIGKGYVPPLWGTSNIRDMKLSQMYPNYKKMKTGLQDCYFDTVFKRLFVGEGYSSEFERLLKARIEAKKKNLSREFVPSSYPKKQSCPGAYDACLGGRVTAFSPLTRDVVKPPKTRPIYPPSLGKKGGPGYANIGINPYPKTLGEPYDDPFVSAQDAKRQGARILGFLGGGHPQNFDRNPWYTKTIVPTYKRVFDKRTSLHGAFYEPGIAREKGDLYHGGIGKYPEYIPPPLGRGKQEKPKDKDKEGAFYPQGRDKTFYTNSVMNRKVDIAVNNTNWKTIQPVTYTREYI